MVDLYDEDLLRCFLMLEVPHKGIKKDKIGSFTDNRKVLSFLWLLFLLIKISMYRLIFWGFHSKLPDSSTLNNRNAS